MDSSVVRRGKRARGYTACKGRIWKVVKNAIEAMAPDLENSPILLENMNFEVFSKFIISKKQNKLR